MSKNELNHRAFWEAGYRVFGLHGINYNGSCECGNKKCEAVGKHPRVSNWQHTPHWSEEQLEAMEESDQFDSGYGVLMRGLFVIDVDARNGGVESYERIITDVPEVAGAGLIVETGSGGGSRHLYFKCDEGLALIQHHPDYKGIDFKSSGFVVGPNSKHVSGNLYKVLYGSPADIDDLPKDIIDGLTKPNRYRAKVDGTTVDVSMVELGDMLNYIPNNDLDYEIWIRIGMALHHASHGEAYDLWRQWSATSSKHDEGDMQKKWHSFGKSANPVTLGTLIYYAEQNGWERPITFEPNEDLSNFTAHQTSDGIDLSGIDLTKPPGFVGEVAQWIHDQCSYERPVISTGAALAVMGNIIGLRYAETLFNNTSNLLVFCVAASATGKESVLQAILEIMRVAELNRAVHGSIKSEQEIIRNLVDHQSAFYVIDEIGFLLSKIKNAQTKGTASYLEGIIGILMSAYSKANAFLAVSGDVRKEISKQLLQELAQINRQIEEQENSILQTRKLSVERSLKSIENGIERPFVSLVGFTTPINFENSLTFENACNGFIGRALVFSEVDTVPKEKLGFKKRPMPEYLANRISEIALAGSFSMTPVNRIEFRDEKIIVPTTEEAKDLLKRVNLELHALAEMSVEANGLEALFLRGKELVSKISFILAAPSGERTVEHVLWAYALVKHDIETKSRLVVGNDERKDYAASSLAMRIEAKLDPVKGTTLGRLINSLRRFSAKDIQKCLDELLALGRVTFTEHIHPYNKQKIKKYKPRGATK